jgi:hypothetical protein
MSDPTYQVIRTYRIVRYSYGSTSEVLKTGLTFSEALEHVEDPDNQGETWYDEMFEEGVDEGT